MKKVTGLFLLIIFLSQSVIAGDKTQTAITISDLKSRIEFLASDSLAGRKPGTPGGDTAAEYIRNQFAGFGLTLFGENGFQYFDVVKSVDADDRNRLSFGDFDGKLGEDFTPLAFSENATVSAGVVFAGYGIDFDADSVSWHDYANVDVSGKWVMILREDPDVKNPHSEFIRYSSLRNKTMVARDKGASGVLVVSGKEVDEKDELMPLEYDQSQSDAGLPIFNVKRTVADKMLSKTGKTIIALEKEMVDSMTPVAFPLDVELSATSSTVQDKSRTQNIVALLPGNDPSLKNEFIIIGAHYDHLGMGGSGSGSRTPDTSAIHNGADDNASGVAAILELAEKMSAERKKIKRSVLFMAFGAEEMGTLGSKFFTKNPLVDLKNVNIMFNLDMVGRLDTETRSLTLGGTGTATGLDKLVEDAAKGKKFELKMSPEGYGPSDHASFYIENIPVLFFFTGVHEDYHTPADDPEKINYAGEKDITEFAYILAEKTANLETHLVYQEAGPKSTPSMGRRFKVTLGIVPDYASTEENGLRIDGVRKGGPAEQAGMEKGDVIVAMEGKKVKNIYDYMYRLAEFKSGQRVSVDIIRNGKPLILIAEL
ncbi:MAG: M20/M25/M40 family metallo-hydrolase [Calditrichaceae bacterium]